MYSDFDAAPKDVPCGRRGTNFELCYGFHFLILITVNILILFYWCKNRDEYQAGQGRLFLLKALPEAKPTGFNIVCVCD